LLLLLLILLLSLLWLRVDDSSGSSPEDLVVRLVVLWVPSPSSTDFTNDDRNFDIVESIPGDFGFFTTMAILRREVGVLFLFFVPAIVADADEDEDGDDPVVIVVEVFVVVDTVAVFVVVETLLLLLPEPKSNEGLSNSNSLPHSLYSLFASTSISNLIYIIVKVSQGELREDTVYNIYGHNVWRSRS